MDELKLLLADGTEISIDGYALPMNVMVCNCTKAQVVALWDQLTEENLSLVSIKDSCGTLLTFHDAVLDGTQTVANSDGTMTAHFFMHGAVDSTAAEDAEYIRAAKILLGEEL